MARIGYFIKNVRENDNPTADTSVSTIDTTFPGTPDFGGKPYAMFYQWPNSLSAQVSSGISQGPAAAASLVTSFPSIAQAVGQQDTNGFDFAHIVSELSQVYTSATTTGASYGDDFRLRVGKRIYIFGYAYSSGDVIDPDTATIYWKE